MTTIFTCIAGFIANQAIVKSNEAAKVKISLVAENDLGYLYAALIVLKIGQFLMASNAGNTRKYAKIHPPDQHVYQVKGAEGSKLGYVLMDYDGANGRFNRAQRAILNYQEIYPQTLAYILASGFVYPKEVFVLTTMFAILRVVSALGYTASVERRLMGFLGSNLVVSIMEVLVGIIAYKTIFV
eukprot:CAMPEP_0171368492 /NCGR_PEP_ID=MMETSP0879-20121228/6753_1 /TAXON_ID=67004 /ORGANISM="Thalassiosira weissflogii, Strain CCMP1336" /LENGTH=183 /DNA_ID=CAMNT_0011876667 /DNA_START=42 /DNA_END=593 /DNA_ORIENTATION=-